MAEAVGARSADHLIHVPPEGIRAMADAGTVATLLPPAAFCLKLGRYAPARDLIAAGVPVALVYGANRSGSAVCWRVTGWPVTREALLVAGASEDDDVLLVSFYNHVPQARALSRVRVEPLGAPGVTSALSLLADRG